MFFFESHFCTFFDLKYNKNINPRDDVVSTCIFICSGHNQEAYDGSPAFTPTVQTFAEENNFEIHDVYGDENCVFRAVADQFMINGCPGHTEVSLRDTAIA